MPNMVFARHESGRLLHVSAVQGGLACKCRCFDCDELLVARKGPVREHHFGHTSGKEHDTSWETHLHAYAKQLIVEAGGLAVPLHEGIVQHLEQPVGSLRAHLKAGAIQLEVARGAVRPDVLLHLPTRDLEIALEVRVTHACDQAKRDEFRRQRLAALEIDLSRFPPERFDTGKLAEAVLHQTENKTWLWPLPPRSESARTPGLVSDQEPDSFQSVRTAEKPQLPRQPLPPPAALPFPVWSWGATVTVSVQHSGEEHIWVRVMGMAIGHMASTNEELAAPRIAEVVAGVIAMHSPHSENPRAGSWFVPSSEATAVVNALHEAAGCYVAQDLEHRRIQASELAADQRRGRPALSVRRAELRVQSEKDPRTNPYARRRG